MTTGFRARNQMFVMIAMATISNSACAGSETGNGGRDERPSEIWFRLLNGDAVVHGGVLETTDAGGTRFIVDQALVRASEVRIAFVSGDCHSSNGWKCDKDHVAFEQQGAWRVDFLNGTVSPGLYVPPGLDLGQVSEVRVKWGNAEEPAIDIAGQLVLPGESEARPFTVILDIEGVSRFLPSDGGGVGDDGSVGDGWVLGLHPARWFEAIDIATCIRDGRIPVDDGGVLHLEWAEGRCRAVVQEIATGFRLDGVAKTKQATH